MRTLTVLITVCFVFLSCSKETTFEPFWCSTDSNTIIYFSPDLQFIDYDKEFIEEIKIRNPDSLVSIYFKILYDLDIIRINGVDVMIDSLSNPLFDKQVVSDTTRCIENGKGVIIIGLLGRGEGFTGAENNGTIAKLRFKAIKPFNTTLLEINNLEIYKYPVYNPPIPIPNDEISIYSALLVQN